MKNATLYFHYPCLDGLVSAMLAWEYLEKQRRWKIANFVPVDYTLRDTWLENPLQKPCAVVDFLFHPSVDFWADHHQTALLNQQAKANYLKRKNSNAFLYDASAPSCAGLLYRRLRNHFSHKPHFEELVAWTEKIDSAAFDSVQEAILGDAPALRINRTLLLEAEDNQEYAKFLITQLRKQDLHYVAGLAEVKRREQQVRRSLEKGLKKVRARARVEKGEVVVFDARKSKNQMISRYAPYYIEPNARYSIGIIRSPEGIGITAMRNPWRKFRSISLGRAFEKFGGGGHQRVGAVRLPVGQGRKVKDVVESLLSKMR
ncbi:MAG TPA: hypothetical protein VFB79_19850 [Candidatus Angelobacter sp.]|nr:hypothetical protein [Candidatus Angelobacter sp.]